MIENRGNMTFKLITDLDAFISLRQPWNDLVIETKVDHAFMRHEWFECWIRNFGNESHLTILTAWQNNRLLGVAPLQIVRDKRRGKSLKIIKFIKASVSPRCNFIFHDSIDTDIFFDAIFGIKGWHIMELSSMAEDQAATSIFIDYVRSCRNFVIEGGIQSPYEILDFDWDTFEKSRSKGNRKNFRNSVNRISKAGEYRIIRLETPEDFDRYIKDMYTISSKSWKAEAGTDLVTDVPMGSFYRDLGRIGGAAGLCQAYLLILNEIPIAFDFYLRHNNKLAGIRWEYDNEYKYYMPGVVLHAHVLKDILSTGQVWEFDLAGMATEFKTGLVKDIRKHLDITVGHPGLYGNMLMYFKKRLLKNRNPEFNNM